MYKKKKKNVKKFRKKFNTRIIRIKQTYSVEEVRKLIGVSMSTISSWRKEGLSAIDNKKPSLFFGEDLKSFLDQRNSSKKRPCAIDELFCCKCQRATRPKDNVVCIKSTHARTNVIGTCSTCGTVINKAISPKKLEFFRKIFSVKVVHGKDLRECTNACAIRHKKREGKR